MLIRIIGNYLRRHALDAPPIDSAEAVEAHRRIIASNPLLQRVYRDWYSEFLPAVEETRHLGKPVIELGCGAGATEQYVPGVIKTDKVLHSNAQAVVDAECLPYADASVAALLMSGVLHHLRHPARCLAEAERCLVEGGRLVLLEPTNSPMHRFVINRFHHYEYHDPSVPEWVNENAGRLSSANTAMSWMIFHRDRREFERRFPRLRIRGFRYHTFLTYYASGGVSYGPLLPAALFPLVRAAEWLAAPFRGLLCTMMTVDIEKASAVDPERTADLPPVAALDATASASEKQVEAAGILP